MSMSIFVDEEGNHRIVTDGVIGSKPGMGIPDSEKGQQVFSRRNKEIIGEVGCETLEEIREADEAKRKQTSPITEAQGDRIIVLLAELLRAHGRNPPTG